MHHFNKIFAPTILLVCAADLLLIITVGAKLLAKSEVIQANESDFAYLLRVVDENALSVSMYAHGGIVLISSIALTWACIMLHEQVRMEVQMQFTFCWSVDVL